jgi:hypothetical protein
MKAARIFLPPSQKIRATGTGSSYVVKSSTDLTPGSWDPATVSAPSDNGTERTLTDTAATGPKKFYRVEITKP